MSTSSRHSVRATVLTHTVDLVVLTVRDDQLKVLLVVRGNPPFRGHLALPGGFLRAGEALEHTAGLELQEETGLDATQLPLRQLKTYSDPDRDPRGRVITTAFLAVAPNLPVPISGGDAHRADWVEVEDTLFDRLAFDHGTILRDAIEAVRRELECTNLATAFLSPSFTLPELRRVFEIVWGVSLNATNFRRKIVENYKTVIVPVGETRRTFKGGRPALLYRWAGSDVLSPPMTRPLT
ncbi:NUDIX hydrolase [Lentzea sp. E54]|uniref:NUDIX hydrolase n=1 Tax=Lentzea xerophila TaxID=3435883 RepID=UPI003DA2794F